MTKEERKALVPVWEKALMTLDEASAYTGIGINKLRRMSEEPGCRYVLWLGSKRLFKREKLLEYLNESESI